MPHTPGPWCALPDIVSRKTGSYPGYRIDSASHALMAWIEVGEGQVEEMTANARLIAAAPDMLEALRGLMSDCEDMWHKMGYTPTTLLNAKTAIAKATGG